MDRKQRTSFLRKAMPVALVHLACVSAVAFVPICTPTICVQDIFVLNSETPAAEAAHEEESAPLEEAVTPDPQPVIPQDFSLPPDAISDESPDLSPIPAEAFAEAAPEAGPASPEEHSLFLKQPVISTGLKSEQASAGASAGCSADQDFWATIRSAIACRVKYPYEERRAGLDGRAAVRISIDSSGRLLSADLDSSTSERFGREALSAVKRAAPFSIPTNAVNGIITATLPFSFHLTDGN